MGENPAWIFGMAKGKGNGGHCMEREFTAMFAVNVKGGMDAE